MPIPLVLSIVILIVPINYSPLILQGLTPTMLILSRIDDAFKRLCQPKIDLEEGIEVTEHSIKVCWDPAPMEEICAQYSKLKVESYDIMMRPTEQKTVSIKKESSDKQMHHVFKNLKGNINNKIVCM